MYSIKYIYIGILTLFISVNSAYLLNAQTNNEVRFIGFNNSDGLPSNTVNAIAKDHLGFIWIGTTDGLCRFESGESIKTYKSGDTTTVNSLASSNIRALMLDSKNNLWIGTRLGGLTKFNQITNTWTTYRHDDSNPNSLSNDEVLSLLEDRHGRIWVGTENGLNIYSPQTNSFTSYQINKEDNNALKARAILSIYEDHQGWIWIGTWAGGVHLAIPSEAGSIDDLKFRRFAPTDKKESLNVWTVMQDSKNRYWIGTRGAGLLTFSLPPDANNNSTEDTWSPIFHGYRYDQNKNSLASDHIEAIFEDSHHNFWVATVDGLNKLVQKNSTNTSSTNPEFNFIEFYYDSKDQNSIISNNTCAILEDNQGIIWFGTHGGISQYNPRANQFEVHEIFEDFSKTPKSQNLFVDKEGIAWIAGGEQGLFKYDFNSRKLSKYTRSKILQQQYISTLYSDDNENLYIGTKNGIFVLNMETHHLIHYPTPTSLEVEFNTFFIRTLLRDYLGRVWIGTDQGAFVLLENDGSYHMLKHDDNNPTTLSDDAITQIYQDSKKQIWIGTYNGLNLLLDHQGGNFIFKHFKHDTSNPEKSIASNRVIALEETNGKLYIGSTSGLSSYDIIKGRFSNFSKNNDKFNIQSIRKTYDGNLWASTTDGIVFFNTSNEQFIKYESRDGLGDYDFLIGSSFVDEKGYYYFGNYSGIAKFAPSSLKKNEIPPAVYITDVRKMGPKGSNRVNSTFSSEIELEHHEYYLSLEYIALNYDRAEKNQYAYKLEGLEKDWNFSNRPIPAIYTNLEHGTYTFRVKAANNDGIWNEEGTTLKIIKKPAYWETLGFQIGLFIITLLLFWASVKYYTRSIEKRNKVLEKYNEDLNKEINQRKIVELELQKRESKLKHFNQELQRSNKDLEQFAYIASHDLQEPLRVVGSFISLLKRRYKQHFDKQAFEYIDFAVDGVQRMSKQIESILTFSQVGKKGIHFEMVNLNSVIENKLRDLSKYIESRNAVIDIEPLPEILCEKNQIEMVFQNLISNAIKFNNKTQPVVTVKYLDQGNQWLFTVQDNGIGIDQEYQDKIFDIFRRLHSKQEYEGTGIGLTLCKKIIHRHQGEIWVSSTPGKGSTFHFTIAKDLKSTIKMNSQTESVDEEKMLINN